VLALVTNSEPPTAYRALKAEEGQVKRIRSHADCPNQGDKCRSNNKLAITVGEKLQGDEHHHSEWHEGYSAIPRPEKLLTLCLLRRMGYVIEAPNFRWRVAINRVQTSAQDDLNRTAIVIESTEQRSGKLL
jgi:hypothetical protein